MVVMEGRNIEDIYPMIELTKDQDVSVRFIEEMPFNGTLGQGNTTFWPMKLPARPASEARSSLRPSC